MWCLIHARVLGGVRSNSEVMAGNHSKFLFSIHYPCLLFTLLNLQNLRSIEVFSPVSAVCVFLLVARCDTVWVIGVVRKPRKFWACADSFSQFFLNVIAVALCVFNWPEKQFLIIYV
jgi:hypothetical protein